MSGSQAADPFFEKTEGSLLGAASEAAQGRYDNPANRSYYACCQAAIAALRRDAIRPSGEQWGHDFVESRFVGPLINRRHRYPADLRSVLADLRMLRQRADYGAAAISRAEADRGLRRARALIAAVRSEQGDDR